SKTKSSARGGSFFSSSAAIWWIWEITVDFIDIRSSLRCIGFLRKVQGRHAYSKMIHWTSLRRISTPSRRFVVGVRGSPFPPRTHGRVLAYERHRRRRAPPYTLAPPGPGVVRAPPIWHEPCDPALEVSRR